MYETIIIKIEERKLEIQNMSKTRYWGLEFDCGAEFSNDIYLNNLYNKLERLATHEEYMRQQKLKKGDTLKSLAVRYNIPLNSLENRIYNLRWSIERALTTPIDTSKRVIHF